MKIFPARSIFLVALAVLMAIVVSCDEDDDDSSSDDDKNDGDSMAGDDDDDDDGGPTGDDPYIFAAEFDPETTFIESIDGDDMWVAALTLSVCDVNDDLSGGNLLLYMMVDENVCDCGEIALSNFVENHGDLLDVDDCEQPKTISGIIAMAGVGEDYFEPGEWCFGIAISDGAGNNSNRIDDVCFTHDPD